MSEENSDSAQTSQPEMDEETYEMIQQLFQIARVGDAAQLKGLFERGFNAPNIRDGKGNSLLMLASYNGNFEAARVLLEHGGDPQLANDMGQIPLAGAAFKGDTEMTRLLIEYGADVNARMPDGKTPLMFAAMFDRTEIIDLLLAHGADASLQANDGLTAQSLAQMMGAEAAQTHLEQLSENLI
jgi:ankyrin repeat protein